MRIACCVPHCKRTRKHVPVPVTIEGHVVDFAAGVDMPEALECATPAARREHIAAKREVGRIGTMEAEIASYGIWKKCKDTASEMAFGLL